MTHLQQRNRQRPKDFQIILGATFLLLGFAADRIILYLAEGDSSVCLQLVGVANM